MHKNRLPDVLIIAFLTFLSLICFFPFYYVAIVSFANPITFMNQVLYILPYSFDLSGYKLLFEERSVLSSVSVSVFTTLVGTLLSILITAMSAYGLSKKGAPFRRLFMTMILITMFFGGQLIPYYVLIKSLKLIDSIWVLILPMMTNTFYLIILKNYFLSLPASLEESAKIDGANDIHIFYRIVVPISLPILASITLFFAVDKWNEWWHAMLFINSKAKWPLQMMLREILANITNASISPVGKLMMAKYKNMNPQTVKMAAILVTAIPILIVYPLLQRYFTKGILIGSIKE